MLLRNCVPSLWPPMVLTPLARQCGSRLVLSACQSRCRSLQARVMCLSFFLYSSPRSSVSIQGRSVDSIGDGGMAVPVHLLFLFLSIIHSAVSWRARCFWTCLFIETTLNLAKMCIRHPLEPHTSRSTALQGSSGFSGQCGSVSPISPMPCTFSGHYRHPDLEPLAHLSSTPSSGPRVVGRVCRQFFAGLPVYRAHNTLLTLGQLKSSLTLYLLNFLSCYLGRQQH
ncbi:hypothetical protein V8E55_010381 [Tylopilus felleus]